MISIGVQSNIDKLALAFDAMAQKQVPFATSLALNRMAQVAKDTLRVELTKIFDRPKPYTVNSIFIRYSSKSRPVATVFHSDKVSPYLEAEIEGGTRDEKRFEINLGRDILVPTRNVKLDSYGGVSKAFISKVLSAAQSGTSKEFVLIREGQKSKLKPGVYQRKDGKIKMLFAFKSSVRYQKRYDMQGIVQRAVQKEFGNLFSEAMDYALSTAKVKI